MPISVEKVSVKSISIRRRSSSRVMVEAIGVCLGSFGLITSSMRITLV